MVYEVKNTIIQRDALDESFELLIQMEFLEMIMF